MIEQLINWIQKSPSRQALLLAFIQAYGWFWFHVINTNMTTYGPNAGADMGLGTFIMGWFAALIWGWIVCWPIARRVIGTSSAAGYIYSAVLFPLALWILEAFETIGGYYLPRLLGFQNHYPDIEDGFKTLFGALGLGILPEGRDGFAHIHAFMFAAIFIAGYFGFSQTIKRRIKAQTK
jgi:hypothetical protein